MKSSLSMEAVTTVFGLVFGFPSSVCKKATFPASASRSSRSFPIRIWSNAFIYCILRFLLEEKGSF